MFTRKYKMMAAENVLLPDGTHMNLRRIVALRDIPLHNVRKGDVGGYVSSRFALSHEDSCWIGGNAKVIHERGRGKSVRDNALVSDEAYLLASFVMFDSEVLGNAYVASSTIYCASVSGSAKVRQSEIVTSYTTISGEASLYQAKTHGFGKLDISGKSIIREARISAAERTAITISGKAEIRGDANNYMVLATDGVGDFISIKDEATVSGCSVKGTFSASDRAFAGGAYFWGRTELRDDAKVMQGVKLNGKNLITGRSVVPPGFIANDISIHDAVASYENLATAPAPNETLAITSRKNSDKSRYLKMIESTLGEYEAYKTDIVKMLKYPAMVDSSVPETKALILAARNAQRVIAESRDEEVLKEAALQLEEAFIDAENKAETLLSTHMDDSKRDSIKKAGQFLSLASNEGATEPERKSGLKAGFKILEGVLPVSDDAIHAFKVKTGLLEIEA